MHRSCGRFAVDVLTLPIAVCLLALAAPARAQDLTGTVRDSVTGQPIRGAVVMLLDERRQPIAQMLSSSAGAFRLRRVNATTLRVIRIGYLPRELAIAGLPGDPLDITMITFGNRLPVVSVSASRVCPERRDSREALSYWATANDGMYALLVAADTTAQPGSVIQLLFNRLLDGSGRNVVTQTVDIVRTGNAAPIRAARTPGELAEHGYIERSAGTTIYYAPDPATLMDSTFAATHCLSVRVDARAHPGQIGVAFIPARDREQIPDIAGVLWLDRSPLALRSLEFAYRGVHQVILNTNAGGQLDFETLSNGVPIIKYWHVRSPSLAWRPTRPIRGLPLLQTEIPVLIARHETGGMIASGVLADGTAWSAPLAHLSGRVLNSQTDEPVPNGSVTLDASNYATTSDSVGQFAFEGVLPGPYVARVVDSVTIHRMRADSELGFVRDTGVLQVVWRTATARVNARLGEVDPFDLRLPWRAGVGGCYGFVEREPRFVVTGFVQTRDGAPLANAQVRVSWADTTRAGITETNIDTHAASDGLFQMCGLPGDRNLEATVDAGNVTYRGTTSVPRVDHDEAGRRRTGNSRRITLVVSQASPINRR